MGQKETIPVTVNYLRTSLSRIVDRKVEITTIYLLLVYPLYGKVVCFWNASHRDKFEKYIFAFFTNYINTLLLHYVSDVSDRR